MHFYYALILFNLKSSSGKQRASWKVITDENLKLNLFPKNTSWKESLQFLTRSAVSVGTILLIRCTIRYAGGGMSRGLCCAVYTDKDHGLKNHVYIVSCYSSVECLLQSPLPTRDLHCSWWILNLPDCSRRWSPWKQCVVTMHFARRTRNKELARYSRVT